MRDSLSVLSCGSVCRSCVTVITRLASTHTALVSQSLVGLCFAFVPSINQAVCVRDQVPREEPHRLNWDGRLSWHRVCPPRAAGCVCVCVSLCLYQEYSLSHTRGMSAIGALIGLDQTSPKRVLLRSNTAQTADWH